MFNMGSIFGSVGDGIIKVLGKLTGNKEQILSGQHRANEAEIAGAPKSFLRLWRSFLGWVLALVFFWEVVGRSIILTYWPNTKLPPSMLEEISTILLGMLGLGW